MKSLITALWERSVMKNKIEPISSEAAGRMTFEIGADRERGCEFYSLSENTSLVYSKPFEEGFGVYLAENWRFEMKVDPGSGRCVCLNGFMSKLTAKQADLAPPAAEPKELICHSSHLGEGMGCYSQDPPNSVLFDPKKRILCLGDPDAEGEAVEFADRTVGVISGERLRCVYLLLDNIGNNAEAGNNLINCIVLV